jgi:IS30 family transposase
MMRVNHETIYRALYVQCRGELRRELAHCLRTGRARCRPRGRSDYPGQIRDMVMISERPAEPGTGPCPGIGNLNGVVKRLWQVRAGWRRRSGYRAAVPTRRPRGGARAR